MLLIVYIVFISLVFIFSRNLYIFLREVYSKPFLTNHYSEFIPSLSITNDGMILNKDGSYSCIIEIKGFPYSKVSDLEQSKQNNFALKERALNFNDLTENIQIKFLFKRFKQQESYNNKNYIELTSDSNKLLQNTKERLIGSLSDFKPSLVLNKDLLEFLFVNANIVDSPLSLEKHLDSNNLNNLCSYSSIDFNDTSGVGIINNFDKKKYFQIVSLSFGSEIDDKFFGKLITSNLEFDFIINSKFFDRISAQSLMNVDKKNINVSSDNRSRNINQTIEINTFTVSNKKINEIREAQEILDNEEAILTVCDIFIVLFGDSEEELNNNAKLLRDIISRYEISLIEEKYLLFFFFLQRLTGFRFQNNMKFLAPYSESFVYAKKILSSTIAGIVDYIEMPSGLTKCDWGINPITTFNTNYNNFYNFYLHINEEKASVGHGVVIAPTGGGKTTLMQYIMQGILESYNGEIDVYSFDRFNGISVFCEWIGGNDINFNDLAINPLQVDLDIEENREFLNNFLTMIAKPETAEDIIIINQLVNMIRGISKEDRILKIIMELQADSKIKENLEVWVNGKYEKYINAKEDKFDLENIEGNFLNFQMDKILDDEELSAPIIYYIMFKIRQKARNSSRGHFIFIDESAKMVKNNYFQSQIEVLLQEHRKLRGCIWLAFQNPNAFLEDKKLKELILNQCQNQLLFTSPAINEEVLANLVIDKSIYDEVLYVQKSNHNPYYVLLKRPSENVILNVNLKDKLGDNLKFLSSSIEDVNRMKKLKEEHGEKWLEYY